MRKVTAIFVFLVTFLTSTEATTEGELAKEDPLFRSLQKRIVGGTQAALGEFPFFVDWGGQCGGSLIHDDIVLSAAHCSGIQGSLRVGALSTKTNQGVQVRSVARKVLHPNYNDDTTDNDYIILKLNQPVTGVTPVQLNADSRSPATGDILTVIGFGATKTGGDGSDILLKVNVDFIPFSQCNPAYAAQGADINDVSMLCAGDKNGLKDSCQGDSGGPLFKLVNGVPTQVGVVSWGFDCADPRFAGIYARVSSAKTWIDKMVCDLSSIPPARCGGGGPNPTLPPAPPPSRAPTRTPPTVSLPTTAPPPSRAPTRTPPTVSLPTTSSPPTASDGKVPVRVDIKLDEYPEETSWSILQGDTVVFSRSYDATFSGRVSDRVMLVPGVDYIFEIYDTEGDGICCQYGNGNFHVYAEIGGTDVLLVDGHSMFGYSDWYDFSVSTSPSSEVAPASAPAIAPFEVSNPAFMEAPVEVSNPTFMEAPVEVSNPASSPSDSTRTDSAGKVSVRIDITSDDWPEETSWSIKQGNTLIFKKPFGSMTAWQSLISKRVMLVPGATYKFEILDLQGDGICCRYGNGNFFVYAEIGGKDVRLFGDNGMFGNGKVVVFTVPGSASPPPSTAPTRFPTSPPTRAPAITSSKAPTRPSGGICFSGEATVQVKDVGTVPMKKLKIGDRVRTASGNYEAVYSFGHRHESVEAAFLQFIPSGLEISKDHMLLVGGKFVPASSVKIGDYLESVSGDMILVEEIKNIVRNGVYAPFTTSGTVVVNNVKASNYIAFQDSDRLMVSGWESPVSFQWIAHVSQSPHRIYSYYLGWSKLEEYTEDGKSTWISGPYELSLWLLNQNGAVMTMILIPAAGLGMLSMAAESIISWFI